MVWKWVGEGIDRAQSQNFLIHCHSLCTLYKNSTWLSLTIVGITTSKNFCELYFRLRKPFLLVKKNVFGLSIVEFNCSTSSNINDFMSIVFYQWNKFFLHWVIAILFPKVEHDSRGQKPQFVLALPPPTLSPILLTRVTRKLHLASFESKYGHIEMQ